MDKAIISQDIVRSFLSHVHISEDLVSDKDFLLQSLTHKSYAADFNHHVDHNERLEFVGDGVLGSIITTLLFIHCPEKEESDMTLYKIALVREEMLAEVARDIGIDRIVLISRGEEKTQGRNKDAILADTLEAFIGYIAIDIGYDQAYRFVERFIFRKMEDLPDQNIKSYKTQIQERSQKKYKQIPVYEDIINRQESNGNVLSYISNIYIDKGLIASGKGASKKKAQENAAMHAMDQLKSGQAQANN